MSTVKAVSALWRAGLVLALGAVVWLGLAVRPAGGQEAAEQARTVVERLAEQAIAVLERSELSPEAKVRELERLLDEAADLSQIAKLVLGRYWRSASDVERSRFVELFRKHLRRQLASRLDLYRGQRLEVGESVPLDARGRNVLVRSRILSPDAAPVAVDWVLRRQGERFRIIDVVVEGVSLLRSQREEVAAILAREGFAGLFARLEEALRAQEGATSRE